jgi:predicted amidohydrolase YtcJ
MTEEGRGMLMLRRANVVTMDPARPSAEAVAIRGDRIVAVGSEDEVRDRVGHGARSVDLDGLTVTPGFIDVHTHVVSNAPDPRNVDLRDFYDPAVRSVSVMLDRLADAASSRTTEDWIVAVASPMQDARLAEGRLPTKAELDVALGGRAGYITIGPHTTLASSRALQLAGITRDGPDDRGGAIDRDAEGEPTGLLREASQSLVKSRRPAGADTLADRLLSELRRCASRGATMIGDVVIHPDEVRAYQELAASGRLPVRVQLMVRVFQSAFDTWALLNLGLRSGFGNDLVRLGSAKVSVDGGFDQAVFRPLEGDRSRLHPVQRMTPSELGEIVAAYNRAGSRLCIHASGDGALDDALSALEAELGAHPRADHRHRIEHMGNWAMTPDHLERARRMNVFPVPNASELVYMAGAARDTFDGRRLVNPFAFRSIVDAGLPLVLASDGGGLWPVDPLRDVAAASRDRGETGLGEELVSPADALAAVTRNAAWLSFEESVSGVLAPGLRADLAILEADPLTSERGSRNPIGVVVTLMGGQVTHSEHPALLREEAASVEPSWR